MATIAVLERSTLVRESLAAILRTQGHSTHKIATCKDATTVLTCQPVDLLIIDLFQFGKEGVDLLVQTRTHAKTARIPFMCLSDVGDKSTVLHAAQLGVVAYLLKDQFTPELFLNKVRRALKTSPPAITLTTKRNDDPAPTHPSAEPSPSQNTAQPQRSLSELKPAVSKDALEQMFENIGEIKALSPTVTQILKLTNSESASIDDLIKVIRMDHAVALKIIKMANSSVFSRGDTVQSLKDAVIRIGANSIRDAVMNISVVDTLSTELGDHTLDLGQFWEHAISTGLAASLICKRTGAFEPEFAFTMGLLHDVGRLMLVNNMPDDYANVLDTARTMHQPIERVEKRMLQVDHAEIMSRILSTWNFPRDLVDPIVFHHASASTIREMIPKRVAEASTLALANAVSHAALLGSSLNNVIYPTVDLCQALDLPEKLLPGMLEDLTDETHEIKFAMLASDTTQLWAPLAEQLRAKLPADARPLFVSLHEGHDAVGLFLDTLFAPTAGSPPNFTVVSMHKSTDRNPISSRLLETEAAHNLPPLPTIVLSPTGKATLAPNAAADRPVIELLQTPFRVETFIDATNTVMAPPQSLASAA